ncbi:hypothetical protein QEN19_000710 [Hanseniaspora menglaensis]
MSTFKATYKKLIKSLVYHNVEGKKKQLRKVIYKGLVTDLYMNKLKTGIDVKLPSVDEIKVDDRDSRLFIIKDTKAIKDIYKNFVSMKKENTNNVHSEIITNVEDFLKNQSEYQILLERYNPGIKLQNEYGSNDYNKKIVEKTAAKVGYAVPEFKVKDLKQT